MLIAKFGNKLTCFSGITTGIYTTNSAEAVYHVLNSSHANIVVVDDSKQMEKIREIRHRLPLLKAAIQIQGPFEDYVKQEDGYYKVNYNLYHELCMILKFNTQLYVRWA